MFLFKRFRSDFNAKIALCSIIVFKDYSKLLNKHIIIDITALLTGFEVVTDRLLP